MSKYQARIVDALKNGAILQSTEGVGYKVWLRYPNGHKEFVRKDSASRVCENYKDKLVFGGRSGVYWKKKS